MVRHEADLGVCLDTDADRVGLVEGYACEVGSNSMTGMNKWGFRLLNRNGLIALVSQMALRGVGNEGNIGEGEVVKGSIVTDSATSNGLTRFIEKRLGGKYVHMY